MRCCVPAQYAAGARAADGETDLIPGKHETGHARVFAGVKIGPPARKLIRRGINWKEPEVERNFTWQGHFRLTPGLCFLGLDRADLSVVVLVSTDYPIEKLAG